MKKLAYTSKGGQKLFKPVLSEKEAWRLDSESQGFCLACGSLRDCVEPDAEHYECDHCQECKVYGISQLVILGIAKIV